MIAILAAMVALLPPAKYDRLPPSGYEVRQVPMDMLSINCLAIGAPYVARKDSLQMGCTSDAQRTIVVPLKDDAFPFDHKCWLATLHHEEAHARGWDANHTGGHTFVCSPKH